MISTVPGLVPEGVAIVVVCVPKIDGCTVNTVVPDGPVIVVKLGPTNDVAVMVTKLPPLGLRIADGDSTMISIVPGDVPDGCAIVEVTVVAVGITVTICVAIGDPLLSVTRLVLRLKGIADVVVITTNEPEVVGSGVKTMTVPSCVPLGAIVVVKADVTDVAIVVVTYDKAVVVGVNTSTMPGSVPVGVCTMEVIGAVSRDVPVYGTVRVRTKPC